MEVQYQRLYAFRYFVRLTVKNLIVHVYRYMYMNFFWECENYDFYFWLPNGIQFLFIYMCTLHSDTMYQLNVIKLWEDLSMCMSTHLIELFTISDLILYNCGYDKYNCCIQWCVTRNIYTYMYIHASIHLTLKGKNNFSFINKG